MNVSPKKFFAIWQKQQRRKAYNKNSLRLCHAFIFAFGRLSNKSKSELQAIFYFVFFFLATFLGGFAFNSSIMAFTSSIVSSATFSCCSLLSL